MLQIVLHVGLIFDSFQVSNSIQQIDLPRQLYRQLNSRNIKSVALASYLGVRTRS